MFEKLCWSEAALRRHQDAPFAVDRERYLQHCFDTGATYGSLRVKSNELLWAAQLLDVDASQGIDMERLLAMADRRAVTQNAPTTTRRFINITRPWLRFLGWWKEPAVEYAFQEQLDQYCHWMRDERGLSKSTIVSWHDRLRDFLQWCDANHRELSPLLPSDIDDYFVARAQRWGRVSVGIMASALKSFLRYAASQGWCSSQLAMTIRSPRIYAQASLPFAPCWEDVRRLLASTLTDHPHDVRDHAILMLLSIYGLRATEVTLLRLDQVDWPQRVIRVFRLKRRQAQVYPLLPSVAEALARYIDIVRPTTSCPEVFISCCAPRRPLTRSAIYKIVSRRFLALGIEAAHRGPHALRHACATHLLAEGLTLKEIGDHLGHRSASASRSYAKVDLAALRDVGDFDLGDLL